MRWWRRNRVREAKPVGGLHVTLRMVNDEFAYMHVMMPSQDMGVAFVLDRPSAGELGRMLLYYSDFGDIPEDMVRKD